MGLALAALGYGGIAASRATLAGAAGVDAVRQSLQETFGTDIEIAGPVTARVFPRPEITIAGVTVRDRAGAVSLAVPLLRASLSWGPLLIGRADVDTLLASDPTGTVDLDTLGPGWRQVTEPMAVMRSGRPRLPSRLVVGSGVLRVRSAANGVDALLTDLSFTSTGRLAEEFSVLGHNSWRGEHLEWQARLDSPTAFLRGRPTPVHVRTRGQDGSFAADGTLAKGWRGQFNGTVAGSTASLPALLRLAGMTPVGTGGLHHVGFTGQAEVTGQGVTLSDARVLLNKMPFEGTLAWQSDEDRFGLFGTLATDRLDLDPFLNGLPTLRDGGGAWSDDTLALFPTLSHDVDLRISANSVHYAGLTAEDAALSLLFRRGRLEVSLGEARAYGGMVKGRVVATTRNDMLETKGDASVSGLDLGGVATSLHLDGSALSGFATGHLALEGTGPTLRRILADASGEGQISIRQGAVGGSSALAQMLRPDRDRSQAADEPSEAFDLASTTIHVDGGKATIAEGSVAGPDGRTDFRGTASLLDGRFILSSWLAPAEAANGSQAMADFSGVVGGSYVHSERRGHVPPPAGLPGRSTEGGYFP